MSDDGHTPETCNYRRCGAVKAASPCPFIQDKPKSSLKPRCEHSWRQHYGPDGYYCIRCLDKCGEAIVA
jgi:hypothetical protein